MKGPGFTERLSILASEHEGFIERESLARSGI